jgi:colicin import membrane protein
VLAAAMLGFAPSRPALLLPPVISVDLLPSLPGRAPIEAVPAPKPAKALPKPPAPPSPPKPKKIVLPKQAPSAHRKPRKVDRPPKREKAEELDYDDAMAQLRNELGENEPAPETVARAEPRAAPGGTLGVRVDPAVAAWYAEVKRHVRAGWITPSEFLERDLETVIVVDLAADGRLRGEPRVVRSSGDPFWDDSAVRAILTAAPLPPPPSPGERQFIFHPEAGL